MGKNIVYQILASHLVEGALEPGAEIAIRIDQTLTQDATGTMAYLQFEAMGVPRVKTELSVSYVDHNTLQDGFENLIGQFEKEHPEVTVLRQVSPGGPRPALLDAAHRAQMLVVGARGLGGVRGMMLGSVSHAVLHHAPCPVAVVHRS